MQNKLRIYTQMEGIKEECISLSVICKYLQDSAVQELFQSVLPLYLYKYGSDCQRTTPPTTMIPMEVLEVNEASPVTIDTMSSSWVIEP